MKFTTTTTNEKNQKINLMKELRKRFIQKKPHHKR